MRAKLDSFDTHVAHEVDEHEVEFGAPKCCQVVVVEGFVAQAQLIRETQELHAEGLFHGLVLDEALLGLQVKMLDEEFALVYVEDARSECIFQVCWLLHLR